MKKLLPILTLLFCLPLMPRVGAQDAAQVYSEYTRLSSVLQSSAAMSDRYEEAHRGLLQLFPQLHACAVRYTQQGDADNALAFAEAYVNMALMPQFEDNYLTRGERFPQMAYFTAYYYYNHRDYARAAQYLEVYLSSGTSANRMAVFNYLIMAYEYRGLYDKAEEVALWGLREYPTDAGLLNRLADCQLRTGRYTEAMQNIDMALQLHPNTPQLLESKGRCLEAMKQYREAADIFGALAEKKHTLSIYRRYGYNLYSTAVQLHNDSLLDSSVEYFYKAVPVLERVVATDTLSTLYLTMLANSYHYTGQYDQLLQVNTRLLSLHAPTVNANAAIADLRVPEAEVTAAAPARPATTAPATAPAAPKFRRDDNYSSDAEILLDFPSYADTYVETKMEKWLRKDEFETAEEFAARVNPTTTEARRAALREEARVAYLARNQQQVRRSDFNLYEYDAENRTYLISSKRFGDFALPVPREGDQAREFRTNWMEVRIENPRLVMQGNDLAVQSIDFVTATGTRYHYSEADHNHHRVLDEERAKSSVAAIVGSGVAAQSPVVSAAAPVAPQPAEDTFLSDVDMTVPPTHTRRTSTFAFIIGNENYELVSDVSYALNDAHSVYAYFNRTLGIPAENIRLYENQTYGKMLRCMAEIREITSAYQGEVNIIFYYAGHGIPDERTRSAFLLPVDADGRQTAACYPVHQLYTELGELGAKSVLVLLDACFSGAQRGEGMIVAARAVALRANAETLPGRMVTLSAASGDETAMPYDEQHHGLFTYYLLKHLQNTKGRTSVGELSDYIRTQVSRQSIIINSKAQNPVVNASADAQDWRKWAWK